MRSFATGCVVGVGGLWTFLCKTAGGAIVTEPVEMRYRPRETRLQGERVMILRSSTSPTLRPRTSRKASAAEQSSTAVRSVRAAPGRSCRTVRASPSRRLGYAIEVTVLHENDCPALLPGYLAVDLGPEVAS